MSKSSYKQSATFGIGRTRKQTKAPARRTQAEWIKRVREQVFRERPNCQICHGKRWDECAGLPDQPYEDPLRSKARGLPIYERFNPRVCGRLCAACHKDVTEHRLLIMFVNSGSGCDGFSGDLMAVRSDGTFV